MKKTPLTERHRSLGAKMVDFAGFEMPLQYEGLREEHQSIRNRVGIFDVSHMGEFVIKGKEAIDLVQYVTSNDASTLEIGQAQYSCLPNTSGGIVDDLLVYRLPEDQCNEGEQAFMLVVNASNITKDLQWIEKHNSFDTRIIDISSQTGLLAVQGPLATSMLQPFTTVDLEAIKYYHFAKGTFANCENVLISATGYTGSGGFELYADQDSTVKIWDALFAKYGPEELSPAGLGARDTLRLEMGYCLYGNDISDSTSPLSAGLGWITKLKKGKFLGSDLLREQKQSGIVEKLVGFKLMDKRVPRKGYEILDENLKKIGEVTSGTFSPTLGIPIGMGYIEAAHAKVDQTIIVSTGRKNLTGIVAKTPFIQI